MSTASPLRPRDAASLILYRRRADGVEVLMGQRNAGHVFMPNRYVFPGGRVDAHDHRVLGATPLRPEVAARLVRATRNPARAHALAIAAIRETYEEAGLMLGVASPSSAKLDARHWAGFRAAGLAPALDRLDYIFRAVTPPHLVRRFDARFFLAEADDTVQGVLGGNGELDNLAWLPLVEATALPLSTPTNLVLKEAAAWIEARPAERMARAVPLLVTRRGKHVLGTD